MDRPLIEMRGVTKIYNPDHGFFSTGSKKQVLALNHIDLSIKKGAILGLVGQSGSGKSTAGRLLVRLERQTSGSISIGGQRIGKLRGRGLKAFRARVQMIFQDPYQSLNPHLSIAETVGEPLVVHRCGTLLERKEKIMETLEIVGLSPAIEFYNRYPHQLSGGQRQRVAIARAIVLNPDFIVADEPTSMLDATIAIQLLSLMKKIREKFGMTFLFITHNLAAARYLCDQIAVIHQGHIVEVNSAENIIIRPEHPYTKKLIKAQPRFNF